MIKQIKTFVKQLKNKYPSWQLKPIEQPVDLDDEVVRWIKEYSDVDGTYSGIEFARHFYELGRHSKEQDNNKLGKIARHILAIKDHLVDMRLDDGEIELLKELGFPERKEQEQPVKELLTFDGFVDKVGSWFANLELRRFRKTFDGEIYPATELVQAYEWFVHELSEKYREKHLQEQPVDWQKVAEAHAKDQPLGQDNDGNLVYLQEHPVCEGLEREIRFYFMTNRIINHSEMGWKRWGEQIARHFAEWGAERFAKIVRENLPEIGNNAQSQFERLYFEITGTKMYGGYND